MSLDQKSTPNKNKLNLTTVSIDTSNDDPLQAKQKTQGVQNMPTVYYSGIQLPANCIKKAIVDSNKFMPSCYIYFKDIYNLLHDVGFPADNAKVSIVIPSNDSVLGQIFIDFKIMKYEVELRPNSSTKNIHIWGICNVEKFLIQKYKSFANTTTYDLMQSVATDAGLGFVSNIDSTNDSQTWNNYGRETYKFLQHTCNTAWAGESSFLWGFIDLYYNMTYVDIEASLSEDITTINWYATSIVDQADDNSKSSSTTKTIQPFLSNDASIKNTNTYFAGEKILNQSTDISVKRGYLRNVHFYDKDGNWSDKAGAYKIYGLDTITSTGNNSQSILLKGDPGSTDFYNENKKSYYMDRMDTINSYPDYLWAKMQNSENLYDLQKIHMQITLPQPNFNIRRFQKLKLFFTNNNASPTGSSPNAKLNGEWLCTGIQFLFEKNTIYQVINIVKRELTINDF